MPMIEIRDYPVFMKIGWTKAERLAPQEVLVSLTAQLNTSCEEHIEDHLDLTLDYAVMMKHIDEILETKEFKLIETIVSRLGHSFLRDFELIKSLEVAVEKKIPFGLAKGATIKISHEFQR